MIGLLLSLAKPNKCLRHCKLLGSYIHPGEHISRKKNKKMDHTLKRSIAKICEETNLIWDTALPVALLLVRVVPRSRLKLSPSEILYYCGHSRCLPGQEDL